MPKWQEKRNQIASIYAEELKYDVICQNVPQELSHNFHKFVIRFEDKEQRKRVKEGLKSIGLNASIHYEKPLSKNSLYITEHHRKDKCTNSQIASDTVMSLPIHAWLTEEETGKICNTIMMMT
jgi:dTDP-4-amino-4,6-dideoxygalactose transaminase